MATSKVIYQGELHTEATHLLSSTTIVTDAPLDNQGRGAAFSPTDLVATALASCSLTIIGQAANTHGFDITGAEVEVTKIMQASPRKIAEIVLNFVFPNDSYSDKQKAIIENSIHTCPVAKSLDPAIKQTINITYRA